MIESGFPRPPSLQSRHIPGIELPMRRRNKAGCDKQHVKEVHAVVMGEDGVGKSALTVRMLTRRFIGEYDRTLESTYRHHLEVNGNCVSLDVLDTAGKNTDEKLQRCASFGELFFILYSITDKSSFVEARRVGNFMLTTKRGGNYTIIVVATKRDLNFYREVKDEDGRCLARDLRGIFYEISSSEDYHETHTMLSESVRWHLHACCTDGREKNSTTKKVREGLMVRTKSLYRKRGMTF